MKEITYVMDLQFTHVVKSENETEWTDEVKRDLAKSIEYQLEVDDVVIGKVKQFVRDVE